MPTESYFCISRQLAKFIISTQNMNNLRVCSTDENKSKKIHVDKIESKRINIKFFSIDERESKIVHEMDISVNMNKVKYTKDE